MVTAAEILSVAGFFDGLYTLALPSFGSERMGSPIVSYCRLSSEEIRSHEPLEQPDGVIVQDPTLLHSVDVFQGLESSGFALINSALTVGQLGVGDLAASFSPGRFLTVPASDLATRYLGRPLPNIPLLGAFVAMTGEVSIDALERAIRQRFSRDVANANVKAAQAAHDFAGEQIEGALHVAAG